MDEDKIKTLTHEELVQEVCKITHQLSYEQQQKIKDKIESQKKTVA